MIAAAPPPAIAADPVARAGVAAYVLDVRALPPMRRPAAITVTAAAPVRGVRPFVTLSLNGIVLARRRVRADGGVTLHARIDDRLLSVRNTLDIAATVPGCRAAACTAAVGGVRAGVPVIALGRPQPVTDFAQLPARMRRGVRVVVADPADAPLARAVHRAIAPLAPVDARAGPTIHVAATPPPGLGGPFRIDLPPVALVARDGRTVLPADAVAPLTAVQIVRGGDAPVLWVRPGRMPPAAPVLERGDVALFAPARVIAWSSASDNRTLRPAYAPGVDPTGGDARTALWRWIVLALWAAGVAGLAFIYRRLPRPAERGA